jgi:hypothetical protein
LPAYCGFIFSVEVTARYKGRASAKAVEKDFPHVVEMMVSEGGFRDRLNAMHDWHLARGIQAKHGQSRRDDSGQYFIRWCFADKETAEAFAQTFGVR